MLGQIFQLKGKGILRENRMRFPLKVKNMLQTIIGIKKDMTMREDSRGHRTAVTAVEASPNTIFLNKENKLQLTFGQKKKVKKTENAYTSTLGFSPRFIRLVRNQDQNAKTGDKVTVANFEPQDLVKVTGTTRGRGFAGGVKRWGFHGGPKTHGQSDRHRAPGSIGQGTTPGRVLKGKHMAGHMGTNKLTITNLEVIEIDTEKNLLFIKGAVPGAKNGLLIVEKTGKAKGYTPPPPPSEEKAEEKAEEKQEEQKAETQEEKKEEKNQPENPNNKEEQNNAN